MTDLDDVASTRDTLVCSMVLSGRQGNYKPDTDCRKPKQLPTSRSIPAILASKLPGQACWNSRLDIQVIHLVPIDQLPLRKPPTFCWRLALGCYESPERTRSMIRQRVKHIYIYINKSLKRINKQANKQTNQPTKQASKHARTHARTQTNN